MSNSYNSGQAWNQSPMNFGGVQLEQEYEFGGLPNDRQQQSFASSNLYGYPQQQQQLSPPNPNQMAQSSSLQGAFAVSQNSQLSHSRSSSFGTNHPSHNAGFRQGVYGSQPNATPTSNPVRLPFRPNGNTTFNFSGVDASHGNGSGLQSNYATPSPGPLQESFPQPSTSNTAQQPQGFFSLSGHDGPQPKRHHGQAFKDETVDEPESELQSDQKDNKSKLFVHSISSNCLFLTNDFLKDLVPAPVVRP